MRVCGDEYPRRAVGVFRCVFCYFPFFLLPFPASVLPYIFPPVNIPAPALPVVYSAELTILHADLDAIVLMTPSKYLAPREDIDVGWSGARQAPSARSCCCFSSGCGACVRSVPWIPVCR
jgi:hypothetical protein